MGEASSPNTATASHAAHYAPLPNLNSILQMQQHAGQAVRVIGATPQSPLVTMPPPPPHLPYTFLPTFPTVTSHPVPPSTSPPILLGEAMPELRKRAWAPSEDNLLRELVQKHGDRCWSRIADELKRLNASSDRIGKQCRDRWCHHLSPDLDKRKWTAEEDDKLQRAVEMMGKQWAEISRTVLPKRSDLSIKNRYYSRMRRENRNCSPTTAAAAAAAQGGETTGKRPRAMSKLAEAEHSNWEVEREQLLKRIRELEEEVRMLKS